MSNNSPTVNSISPTSSTIALRIGDPGKGQPNNGTWVASQGPNFTVGMQDLTIFESYTFHQHFLHNLSTFNFVVGGQYLNGALGNSGYTMRQLLVGGQRVSLQLTTVGSDGSQIRQVPIATGLIDEISKHIDDKGGTHFDIKGRNFLALAADGGIDPFSAQFQFEQGQTMGDILGRVFAQFGISLFFYGTDVLARDIVTGFNPATTVTTSQSIPIGSVNVSATDTGISVQEVAGPPNSIEVQTDPTAPTDIEQLTLKRSKPEPHETSLSFAETHAKRFHTHIWGMPDGSGVILGVPDYTQSPTYTFTNRLDGVGNNVENSKLDTNYSAMPNIIVGKLNQGGGDGYISSGKAYIVNEFTGMQNGQYIPSVQAIIDRFPNITSATTTASEGFSAISLSLQQTGATYFNPIDAPRGLYWHDKTSHTMDQLYSALIRRMSEFQRNAIRYTIVVNDHQQNGIPYYYNTQATIVDEDWDIPSSTWWIESVEFRYDLHGGTRTTLTLLPQYTIFL